MCMYVVLTLGAPPALRIPAGAVGHRAQGDCQAGARGKVAHGRVFRRRASLELFELRQPNGRGECGYGAGEL